MDFLLNLCCICLQHKKDLQQLFCNDANSNNNYYLILTSLFPEMVFEELQTYGHICVKCCSQLDGVKKFHEKCLYSKKIITDYISNDNIGQTDAMTFNRSVLRNSFFTNPFETECKNTEENKLNKNNSEEIVIKTELEDTKSFVESFNELDYTESGYNKPIWGGSTTTEEHFFINNDSNIIITEEINIKTEFNSDDLYAETDFVNNEDIFSIELPNNSNHQSTLERKKCDNIQENKKRFKCRVCKKSFVTKPELILHKTTHKVQTTFKCKYCQKTFTKSGNCTRHEKTHAEVKPFRCEQCQKTFSRIDYLAVHRETHLIDKHFKCNYCDKTYSTRRYVNRHEKTHAGEKSFKCNQCERAYTQRSALVQHKLSHSGQRPFKCAFCDKSYKHVTHLKVHERTHTGEKPFSCDKCPKSFKCGSHLNAHKRIHL